MQYHQLLDKFSARRSPGPSDWSGQKLGRQRSEKRNVRMQTIKYIFRLLVTHFSTATANATALRCRLAPAERKIPSPSEKKLTHAALFLRGTGRAASYPTSRGNSSAIANKAFHFFGWEAVLLLLLSKVMSTIALALLLTLGKWRPPAERLQPTFCPQSSAPDPAPSTCLLSFFDYLLPVLPSSTPLEASIWADCGRGRVTCLPLHLRVALKSCWTVFRLLLCVASAPFHFPFRFIEIGRS